MTLRTKITVAAGALVLALAGVLCLSCASGVTPDEVEEWIAAEAPVGSDEAKVLAFLDARRIEHSALFESTNVNSDFRELGESKKRLITAAIRDARHDLLVRWDICMTFRFDEAGRLVEHRVRNVGTGL